MARELTGAGLIELIFRELNSQTERVTIPLADDFNGDNTARTRIRETGDVILEMAGYSRQRQRFVIY